MNDLVDLDIAASYLNARSKVRPVSAIAGIAAKGDQRNPRNFCMEDRQSYHLRTASPSQLTLTGAP